MWTASTKFEGGRDGKAMRDCRRVVRRRGTHMVRREVRRREAEPLITAVFMMNGGLFADAHTHPWQGTPMLGSPLGVLGARGIQRSPASFVRGWTQARMYSRDYRPSETELRELWSAL